MSSKGKLNGNQNSPEPKWMELHDGTFSLIDDELNDSIIAQHFQPNHKKMKKKLNNEEQNANTSKCKSNGVNNQIVGYKNATVSSLEGDPHQSSQIVNELTTDFDTLQISNGLIAQSSRKSDDQFDDMSSSDSDESTLENEQDSDYESPDDSEDDSILDLVNKQFTIDRPQFEYVSAQTDTFPHAYNSDDESEADEQVTFSINNNSSVAVAVAEYKGNEYHIGFLDLTTQEHSYLQIISQTSVKLSFNANDIEISRGKFNIKRIKERVVAPNPKKPIAMWSKVMGMDRIQFSTTEPFLAKYRNEVYFVGDKLHDQYLELLDHSKKRPGTAIRIRTNRLNTDADGQILDTNKSVSFKKQAEICVISTPKSDSIGLKGFGSNEFRRYVITKKRCEIMEIESALLHSSIHDEVTEIYAETDFPFTKSDHVQQQTAKKKPATPKEKPVREIQINPENRPLKMNFLKNYVVPDDIKTLVSQKKLSKEQLAATRFGAVLSKKNNLRKNLNDYIEGYKMMIHIEEEEQSRYLDTFNQTDIEITYYMDKWFRFPVTNAELVGAIEESLIDRFILKPKKINALNFKKEKQIWGQIVRLSGQDVIIEIFPESYNHVLKTHRNEIYDIFFTLNRMPYQLQHYVLDFVVQENLFTRLINNSYYHCKSANLTLANGQKNQLKHKFDYNGTTLNKLNLEQKSAVERMIAKVDTLPYVLFGPPGTGKTRTLVAAIEQIVRTTNKNILVCAMSNAACDEITERLFGVLEANEMYRFYARSFKNERIGKQFMKVSNFSGRGIFYPSLKYLYKFRVLICTLCSAGCLTRAREDAKVWRPDHFGYVIIDECASAPETMALIPVAGLCTSNNMIHAKIIIAGDPKQLDAVTKSYKSKQLGYNISWLEQLCRCSLYMRNASTGQYNPLYITQLVKNYRSHPKILSIPNELFYENKLEPHAAQSDISWYINSKFLPSKQFPMVFMSVQGKCERSIEQSWYNSKEIEATINVIKRLMPPKSAKEGLRQIAQSDIGVVTPYRKQKFKLLQRLRYLNFDEVMVGTAEIFQGKEKPVMIISTVRSDGELGFVEDPRRLNVVITRAKCLLVIIGDPHTLSRNENWRRFIDYCMENKSLIQSDKVYPEEVKKLNRKSRRKSSTKLSDE